MTHAARPSPSSTILPTFCLTNPHRAERRRIAWDDRVHLHPADQGECDSDGPSRTDPNDLHPAENRKVGGSMPSLPIAPPQLDVAGPRSALGPCRSGRARASAGTNGRQGFRGPAGRRASISAAGMMQVGDSDCGPKVGVGVPSVTPAPFPQLKGHTAPDGAWQPDHAWLQFCERFPITNLRQIA